jgi:hypothetical protein
MKIMVMTLMQYLLSELDSNSSGKMHFEEEIKIRLNSKKACCL